MRNFITDKIINHRTSLIITNCDEQDIKLKNRDTMNKKLAEFRKIQAVGNKHYNPKTLKKYFISNMFNVDYDKRPTYTVAISWYVKDCYDFVEYTTYNQILYY
jgi:hypothetical protein